jgi:hypothetical protein
MDSTFLTGVLFVFQTAIDYGYRKGHQTGGAAIPLTWIMLLQATTMTGGWRRERIYQKNQVNCSHQEGHIPLRNRF